MRTLVTLAVALGLVGLTAEVGLAQSVTVDKINLVAANAPAPELVSPEGEVSVLGFIAQAKWKVFVTFGTYDASGTYQPFANTEYAVQVTTPTLPSFVRWKTPGSVTTQAVWGNSYLCRAELRYSYAGLVWTLQSKAIMRVK